ncbi:MAG: septation protein SepH [Micropruina sp.]|uniref:septation protein SepH n=1 Tax=Micropruina sp. TaxID=2737536 RepID=UPI0039E3D622
MRTAHPLGLTPDGRSLIVVLDDEQVAIPADERLKTALRNDRARIGQLEIDMESALRPRDIQARIRAGESLEAVAEAAGVPIARIEPFAAPVIAERDHIAGLAQTNPVRRAGDAVAHRSLRNVVTDRLLSSGIDIDDVEWDAWRTEDRRWTVRLSYEMESVLRQADFGYDQTGRFSVAANDDARWLTGESAPERARSRLTGDPDTRPGADRNDELAIVRAIQPQFAITPDLDDDLLDEPDDDSGSDSEDAFAEGDLAEVDGVYDIVPGDRTNLDVLYDMLSSFDEDSVQIYAGLVRPRAEQPAAPALDEGPASGLPDGELLLDAGEPTERIMDVDEDEAPSSEESPATSDDSIEAEPVDGEAAGLGGVVDEPQPVEPADSGEATERDAAPAIDVPGEPEPLLAADHRDDDEPDHGDAHAPAPDDVTEAVDDVTTNADEVAADEVDADEVAGEPAEAAPVLQAESASPADATTQQTRPGRIKPAPGEPEQPSLVDEAGNEPSRPLKRKRASVPSWDEIMFGAPKPKS